MIPVSQTLKTFSAKLPAFYMEYSSVFASSWRPPSGTFSRNKNENCSLILQRVSFRLVISRYIAKANGLKRFQLGRGDFVIQRAAQK